MNASAALNTERGPFNFFTEVQLVEATGETAVNLTELLHHLETASGSVIFCHTFRTLNVHHFIIEGFQNDFAFWVGDALGDDELSERLSSIDLVEYTTIRSFRERMIEIIKEHIEKNPASASRSARDEDRFFFCSAHSFVLPSGRRANNLEELANHIGRCSQNSLFFHFIEARLRVGEPINDFSVWIAQTIQNQQLADSVNALNPYIYTLDQLRSKIISLIETEI